MISTKTVPMILIIIVTATMMIQHVRGESYDECKQKYGPPPSNNTCDRYIKSGNNVHLKNNRFDVLNTAIDTERVNMTATRLDGQMPDEPGNLKPIYNPLFDAFCFNEDYPIPTFPPALQFILYQDYKSVFDKVKAVTTDVSIENNNVTNDRIPGMFLRMCFHDNAIDNTQLDFQDYVAQSIETNTTKWIGESRYLKTSGADASNLICPEERYHPNNNFDQTASRVLRQIQTTMKSRYKHLSYADLLHNGCNAATIYLTKSDPYKSLMKNPFTFGRKDACHIDPKCTKRYPLCGPTELLPANTLSVTDVTTWFTSRGMSECLFMGLMWTHTTVDTMASLCPIQRLTCTTNNNDVSTFTESSKLYFQSGNTLDYFNFFLEPGSHETIFFGPDNDDPGCTWIVNGQEVPWPMVGIDCTLGYDNAMKQNSTIALANVIKNFAHNPTLYNRIDILQCGLKVLSGKGSIETGGACSKIIPKECQSSSDHKFGAYYSTLIRPVPSWKKRISINPKCEPYGYDHHYEIWSKN